MSDVFISYSRKDIAFARLIREALQQSEIDTWIDWERIPVGQRWWAEICEAIENANVFMFIISQNSIGSQVCKDEIDQALKNHKRIIPIVVDDLSPQVIREFAPDLPQFNWIIFERDHLFRVEEDPEIQSDKPEDREVALPKLPQFAQALEKLSLAIHTDWEWVKYHTRLQVNALLWENNGQNPSYLMRGAELEEAEQRLFQAGGRDPQPTPLQGQYVTASRQEESRRQQAELQQQQETLRLERKARQRQQLALWAVGMGLVVAVILGLLAFTQRNQAVSQSKIRATAESNALAEAHSRATAESNAVEEAHSRATAEANAVAEAQVRATAQAVAEDQRKVAVEQRNIALSRQLAAQAINQIGNKDISLSLLLSVEAYRHGSTMDARSSLLRLIQTEPRLRYYLYAHGDTVWGVAISPDGKTIASAGGDSTVGVWDMATGKPVHAPLTGHTKAVQAVAFSPDGRTLASGGQDGQLLLWDLTQGFSQEALFKTDGAWVYALAFSRDGKFLAAALTGKTVLLWSMADKKLVCPLINGQSESQVFVQLAFSPDGLSLAVGNDAEDRSTSDRKLAIWDTATCQQKGLAINTAQLAGLTSPSEQGDVRSLAYSPDGKQLAVGEGEHLLVLDSASRQPLREAVVPDARYPVSSLAYSPDGRILALGMGDKTIVLLDSATGQAIGSPLIGQRGGITSIAFSSDGHSLVSGGWDWAVLVWDLENQPLSRTLAGHTGAVRSVAFSPDGTLLASAGADESIRLWDTTTWQMVGQPLTGASGEVMALAFSPDGKLLASGGRDQLLRLWEPATGQPLGHPLAGQGAEIYCLAFSPDGKWLAAGGPNNRLTVWEVVTRTLYKDLQFNSLLSVNPLDLDFEKYIGSVGFTPDSATLYFSRGGGFTGLFDLASLRSDPNAAIRTLKWSQLSSTNEILARLSPDGKLFALANSMVIRLYDAVSLQMVGLPMLGHTNEVTGLAFTPDGGLLASSSQDATVRLWDPATGQPVGLPLSGHSQWIAGLDISPDGRWLASASGDATVRVWDLAVQDWQSLACQIARRNLNGPEWQQYLPDELYHATCPDEDIPPSGVALISGLASTWLREGKNEEAQTILQDGLDWVLSTESVAANNSLCWFGSLDGFAVAVLPACERAVSLAPASQVASIRDSRGLARALAGKTSEAIEDFQAFVDWSKQIGLYEPQGRQREEWIAALSKGQNPFDEQVLQSLRSQ